MKYKFHLAIFYLDGILKDLFISHERAVIFEFIGKMTDWKFITSKIGYYISRVQGYSKRPVITFLFLINERLVFG